VANPEELVMPQKPVSYYYIEQYRAQKSLFAGVAAFQNGVPFNVALQSECETGARLRTACIARLFFGAGRQAAARASARIRTSTDPAMRR
jgi:hypothetical protein